ncbi:aminotransferase [Actinoplanes capillaceus]|uniref:Aminotransferase n=1 Tax=Actinoplanes campanulatus TaxID=113559 RepID=A0ABQ3WYZ9_9ACTN|nr:aminotransferase class I/II-fold pyridoxal phosphate-dependent enzyme [Actinoplanes capillaceus]GID51516.1 aminotransferase [Actinoplanes capillaceus]
MNRETVLAPLATQLQQFDQLHTATLRRFGARTIDLSYPNPRTLADDRPYRALADLAATVAPDALRYSPFGGFTVARRHVASVLTQHHGIPYHYRDVILTPGAAAALNLAFTSLFTPADRIMLITPCWMDYPLYLAHLGLHRDLVGSDPDKRLDLDAIERAWTPDTRGVVLSQPVSPTGVCYRPDELGALAVLLARLGVAHGRPPLLINDETHRDQVWAGPQAVSPARFYPHSVSVYSYGKSWQMQGQRTGYLAIHPGHPQRGLLRDRLTLAMRVTGYCAPTALTQHLISALSPFTPDLGPLADLQQHARSRLSKAGYDVIDATATPFVYVRTPIADDTAFVRRAADHAVLVMPSRLFHEPGYIRLALNLGGPDLDEALDVLTALAGGEDA